MIHIISPWSSEKNFGKAINDAIERLNPDANDWVLLKDGDSCFLTPDWGNQLETIVANAGDYDLIGCLTNRLREPYQLATHSDFDVFNQMDMKEHYEMASLANEILGCEIKPFRNDVAGFFMLFRVSAWMNNKFRENTPLFDRYFTRGIKKGRVGIVPGLYVLHLYRLWSDNPKNDSKHLF